MIELIRILRSAESARGSLYVAVVEGKAWPELKAALDAKAAPYVALRPRKDAAYVVVARGRMPGVEAAMIHPHELGPALAELTAFAVEAGR